MGVRVSIVPWLYFALMESSARKATLGESALGVMVTSDKGERISFRRATVRHFARYVSGFLPLWAGFLIRFSPAF
jgi:uncharacterized RDD family membrane protein YckC